MGVVVLKFVSKNRSSSSSFASITRSCRDLAPYLGVVPVIDYYCPTV